MVELAASLGGQFVKFVIPIIARRLPERFKQYVASDTERILQTLKGQSAGKLFTAQALSRDLETKLKQLETQVNERDRFKHSTSGYQINLSWDKIKRHAEKTNEKAYDAFGDQSISPEGRIEALQIMIGCAAIQYFHEPLSLMLTWKNCIDYLMSDPRLTEIISDNQQKKFGADKRSYDAIVSFLSSVTAHTFELAVIYGDKNQPLADSPELHLLVDSMVSPAQHHGKFASLVPKTLLNSASNILGIVSNFGEAEEDILANSTPPTSEIINSSTKPKPLLLSKPNIEPKTTVPNHKEAIKSGRPVPTLSIKRPTQRVAPEPRQSGSVHNAAQFEPASNTSKQEKSSVSTNQPSVLPRNYSTPYDQKPRHEMQHEPIPDNRKCCCSESFRRCMILVAVLVVIIIALIVAGIFVYNNIKNKKIRDEKNPSPATTRDTTPTTTPATPTTPTTTTESNLLGFMLLISANYDATTKAERCTNNGCRTIEKDIQIVTGSTTWRYFNDIALTWPCAAIDGNNNVWLVQGDFVRILNTKSMLIDHSVELADNFHTGGCAFLNGLLYACRSDGFDLRCQQCDLIGGCMMIDTVYVIEYKPIARLVVFDGVLYNFWIDSDSNICVTTYNTAAGKWRSRRCRISPENLFRGGVPFAVATLGDAIVLCQGMRCFQYEPHLQSDSNIASLNTTDTSLVQNMRADRNACPNIVSYENTIYAFGLGPSRTGIKKYVNQQWVSLGFNTILPQDCSSTLVTVG